MQRCEVRRAEARAERVEGDREETSSMLYSSVIVWIVRSDLLTSINF